MCVHETQPGRERQTERDQHLNFFFRFNREMLALFFTVNKVRSLFGLEVKAHCSHLEVAICNMNICVHIYIYIMMFIYM